MSSKSRSFLASPEGLQKLEAAKGGLSYAALAKKAGVSADTVSRLFHPERGKRVSEAKLIAIAQALNLVPEEIFSAEGLVGDSRVLEAQRRIQSALDNQVETLDLLELGLTTVPKELGQLANLTQLYLDSNDLTTVPKELGRRANLPHVYRANNKQ